MNSQAGFSACMTLLSAASAAGIAHAAMVAITDERIFYGNPSPAKVS